ncbi:MAG: ATP-binding protein [Promethearchaeia archaeon]
MARRGARALLTRALPAQAITFSPPLTLILGPNGSGKTTIIEVRAPAASASTASPPAQPRAPNHGKNKRWTMARRKNGCLQSLAVHVTAQASTRLTRFRGGRTCSRCGWPRAAFFHRTLVCRTCALVSVPPACVGILPPQTGYCTTRVTMSILTHANAYCDAALAIVT